jgi:hypothetical protein
VSAPAKPAAEQVTQPLEVPLPPQGCRSAESGVWLVPATVLAAVAAGQVIRAGLAAEARFTLVLCLLVGLLVLAGTALLGSRVIDR